MGKQKKTERDHMAASGKSIHPSSNWIPGMQPTNKEVGGKDASRGSFQVEFILEMAYKALGSSVHWQSFPTQTMFLTLKYASPTVSNDVIALKLQILVIEAT